MASCQNDDGDINIPEPPLLVNGGNDFLNVNDFKVVLNADALKPNEEGVWSIQSGLIDEKVFFDDAKNPKTVFHGLPGEEYKLIWKLTSSGKTNTGTVVVSFSPLQTEILNLSPDFYKTRLHLQAKSYGKGVWTIEGKYDHIWNLNFGGTIIPDNQSPHILFYGFENTQYKLTWTTWYGSKSASATITFDSSVYQQDEALEDLTADTWQYKKDLSGNVTELNMAGDARAWIYQDLKLYPSIQSLIHLKKLYLSGDGLTVFPEVISSKYINLEVLDISHNAISSLPENFGNLTKLDTLKFNYNNYNKTLSKLPDSFGQLKNLKYLDLTLMGLNTLPESFSDLKNLNCLNLALNHIAKLPDDIGNLSNLETITIELGTNIPNSFSNLTNLKKCNLYIVNNSTAVLPVNFGNLKKLENLNLYGKFISLPNSFSNLINLKDLEITGGSTINKLPDNFGNLVNLENIRIAGSFTTLPDSFTNLRKLKNLELHGSLEYLPANIGNLKALEWLSVSSMNLKEIPESFGNLENLKYFRAYLNQISTIPDSLGNLKKIYEINLSYNNIKHFPSTLTNLSDTLFDFVIRGNNFSEQELSSLKKMLPATRITTD